MTCEACLAALDEYVEGELARPDSLRVAAHLAGCSNCAAHHEELLREQQIYAGYLLDVEATPALWRGLRESMEQRSAARRTRPLARARGWLASVLSATVTTRRLPRVAGLAVLSALVAAVAIMSIVPALQSAPDSVARVGTKLPDSFTAERPVSLPPATIARSLPPRADSSSSKAGRRAGGRRLELAPTGLPAVAEESAAASSSRRAIGSDRSLLPGEKSYLEAIAQLTALTKKSSVSPQTGLRAEYERNMAAVDKAIAETRQAARLHPDDPQMAQFVLAAYRGKLGLLTSMVEQSRAPAGF